MADSGVPDSGTQGDDTSGSPTDLAAGGDTPTTPGLTQKDPPPSFGDWFGPLLAKLPKLLGTLPLIGPILGPLAKGLPGLFDDAGKDPIILDLNGDGVKTQGQSAGVFFDHDNKGFAQLTGWADASDGILVRDLNGNDQIDNGAELFGNSTLLSDGRVAANGFEALADLDGNKDGVLDANDAAFTTLRVWQDQNSNGLLDEGELCALEDLGIVSLNTSYTNQNVVDEHGNAHRQVGSFTFADGTTGQMADVWFATDTSLTLPTEWFEVSDDIAALPDMSALGNVYSLHQAMSRDESGVLKTLVEQFAAEGNASARKTLLEQLIFTWAGAAEVASDSRDSYIDARKVASLEAFMGTAFR